MKKNIVILGGTSGVGRAITRSFAAGHDDEVQLLVVGRNAQKAQAVKTELQGKLDFALGDLTNLADQQDIFQQIQQKLGSIDVLIDTFGVFPSSAELNIRSNLQAHDQMIHLLQPLLAKSQQARVLLVTGNPQAVKLAPICEEQRSDMERAIWEITHKTLLMKDLAQEFSGQNITVNAFYPGEVQSDLMPWTRNLTNQSVTVGRFLALSDSLQNMTGAMFDQFGQEIALSAKYNAESAAEILEKYRKNY